MNPSCNLEEGLKGFRNLGDPPFSTEGKDTAVGELLDAGLPRGSYRVTTREVEVYKADSEAAKLAACGISMPSVSARSETEWVVEHEVTAEAYGWKFRRAWYYWSCGIADQSEGSVPYSVATELHAQHGQSVRTEGYAGGSAPDGDVGRYHVDTPLGLRALVEVLKQEHSKRKAAYDAAMAAKYNRRP